MRLVPMEGDRFHLSAEEAVEALRREHDRRRGDPRLDVRRLVRAGAGDLRRARHAARRRPASTSRCTSTAPPARSSRRSSTPSWCGTSGCRRVASINASGHKYGLVYPGRRLDRVARRRGAAGGADLLGQLPRRRHADVRAELLAARARRSSPSTTTSCASASTATARCSGYARDVATQPVGDASRELGPFELITTGDELPVFAFKRRRTRSRTSPCSTSRTTLRERGWLATRVHVPGEPDGPRGPARRRQARLQPRHGRPADRRPRAPAAAAREAAEHRPARPGRASCRAGRLAGAPSVQSRTAPVRKASAPTEVPRWRWRRRPHYRWTGRRRQPRPRRRRPHSRQVHRGDATVRAGPAQRRRETCT